MATGNTLEESILDELRCPVCTDYMLAEIRQCIRGHCHCNSCFYRIKSCSLCRGELSPSSYNYTLEGIVKHVTFPCRYQTEGCVIGAKGSLIKKHEKYCGYVEKRCPIMSPRCPWIGRMMDLTQHALDSHVTNIYFEPKKMLVVKDVISFFGKESRQNDLFVVFNKMFRLMWKIHKESDDMKFAVHNISSKDDKFSYKIVLFRGKTTVEAISYSCLCFYCNTDEETQIPGHCLVANIDMLKSICDDQGDLHYTLEISCNNSCTNFVTDYFPPRPSASVLDNDLHLNQTENEEESFGSFSTLTLADNPDD